ncbi:MAG: hypothetical protein PHU64_04615 [Candidatus Omnitrophica bacterium]|nr:hypothetical protein [Candidatus Omnitrophota bacterium]
MRYTQPGVFVYAPNLVKDMAGFLKFIFGNLIGRKTLYFLLLGMLFPLIFPVKERFKQILFLFIMVFFPIGLLLLSNIVNNYFFVQRQFIWVMPLFAFLIGWNWDSFLYFLKTRFRNPGLK